MILKNYKLFLESDIPTPGLSQSAATASKSKEETLSRLFVDADMYQILNEMYEYSQKSDPIVYKVISNIYRILNQSQCYTSCNYLKPGNSNDEIYFMLTKKLPSVYKFQADYSFYRDANQISKAGRIFRKILEENGYEVIDKELEAFVNVYKQAWDMLKGEAKFKIVEGEDIKKYYLVSNYTKKTRDGYGSLGKSCMSHGHCQGFLNLYSDNPEVCKLVVQLGMDGKVSARALLWKLEDRRNYLDRIYYTTPHQTNSMLAWFSKNYGSETPCFDRSGSSRDMRVKLKKWKYDYNHELGFKVGKYPYMDTFYQLIWRTGTLATQVRPAEHALSPILQIRRTDGIPSQEDSYWIWSVSEKRFILRRLATFNNDITSYVTKPGIKFLQKVPFIKKFYTFEKKKY